MSRSSAGLAVAVAATAQAQQRPLTTEDPETVGTGNILLEAGMDVGTDVFYPLSGLKGTLLRAPVLGVTFGIGPGADIHLSGGPYNRLSIHERSEAPYSSEMSFSGDTTHDVEDLVLSTKVRVLSEKAGRPAVGVRFATRLPNSKHHSGLGLDTFDFHVQALAGKSLGSTRVVGNIGLGILAAPTNPQVQNDVLDYGASVTHAVLRDVEVVGEINGRLSTRQMAPPIGTESRSIVRFGARMTRGHFRVHGAVFFGLTSYDPTAGFAAGVSWMRVRGER
jgi:hypothetical protein